jgi:hypothetical protein
VPLANVVVSSPIESTHTDDEGTFALRLPPGDHDLVGQASGMRVARMRAHVPRDGNLSPIVLVLQPGRTIDGIVTVDAEVPARHLNILAWPSLAETPVIMPWTLAMERVVGRDVTTDKDGRFVLRGLDPVPHDVMVNLSAHPKSWDPESACVHHVLPDGSPVRIQLISQQRRVGKVLDRDFGAPIATFLLNGTWIQDPAGRFNMPLGDWLLVYAHGFLPHESWNRSAFRDSASVAVPLARSPDARSLRVAVVDSGTNPISRADILLWYSKPPYGLEEAPWLQDVPIPVGGYEVRADESVIAVLAQGESGGIGITLLGGGADEVVTVSVPDESLSIRLDVPGVRSSGVATLRIEAEGGRPGAWRLLLDRPTWGPDVNRILFDDAGIPHALTVYDDHEARVLYPDERSALGQRPQREVTGLLGLDTEVRCDMDGLHGVLHGLPEGRYVCTLGAHGRQWRQSLGLSGSARARLVFD